MAQRGRPKKENGYSKIINVRFTEKQVEFIQKWADNNHKDISTYIRECVLFHVMQEDLQVQ